MQPIVGKLKDFLAEDLANRNENERWFLDKGDGSVWFASPDGITKAIKNILDKLGIEGGAIHFFRKARLNEIHLSACWISLGQLLRQLPAGRA